MQHDTYPDYYLADILRQTKTIALVGASPNPERPSHRVMAFLLRKGYRGHSRQSGAGRQGYPGSDGRRQSRRHR